MLAQVDADLSNEKKKSKKKKKKEKKKEKEKKAKEDKRKEVQEDLDSLEHDNDKWSVDSTNIQAGDMTVGPCDPSNMNWMDEDHWSFLANPEKDTSGILKNCLKAYTDDQQGVDDLEGFYHVSPERLSFNPISRINVAYADQGSQSRKFNYRNIKDDIGSKLCSLRVQYFDDPKFYQLFSNTDDKCDLTRKKLYKKEFKF